MHKHCARCGHLVRWIDLSAGRYDASGWHHVRLVDYLDCACIIGAHDCQPGEDVSS